MRKQKINWESIILLLIGAAFFSLGYSAVINTAVNENTDGILWFCYAGLMLMGIGVLGRKPNLILSQLNILVIPLIFWNIDFFAFLINGESLFGIVDYFFEVGPIISRIITLQHLFTLPLAFYALYKIKIKEDYSLEVSYVQLILVYIFTILVTSEGANINCVNRSFPN